MIFLEGLYYISSVVLVIIAGIGLKQLTINKNNAKMTAKRDSFKLAASQILFYSEKIIKLQDKLDDKIYENNIKIFDEAHVDVKGDKVKVKLGNKDYENFHKIVPELLDALNAMESFAIFFTSGVADEKIAFNAVGKTYCNSVKKLMPELITLVENGYHKDILKLFFIWNNRFERQKLKIQKEDIDKKLEKVNDKFIKPLGT